MAMLSSRRRNALKAKDRNERIYKAWVEGELTQVALSERFGVSRRTINGVIVRMKKIKSFPS